jgi:NhaP-type Na+/H+ or K+/H+ antiporter
MSEKRWLHFLQGKQKLILIFILIFLSSIFGGVTLKILSMYRQLQKASSQKTAIEATQDAQSGHSQYGKRVRELAVVPAGEEPEEALVSNVEQIKEKNPGFYEAANNGDVLLLYKSLAVIYSPSKDKIIAMMSYSLPNIASESATTTPTPTPAPVP